jgi:hypothetical protein
VDETALVDHLAGAWAESYSARYANADLVEVDQGALTFLFDLAAQRVVGVYGRSVPTVTPRPASRMRGHPLPLNATALVRGHLIAHSIGGGTDINLVPQNAAVNVSGAWRGLERLAQQNPDCVVAIEAAYDDESQTAASLTYLVAYERTLTYRRFENLLEPETST